MLIMTLTRGVELGLAPGGCTNPAKVEILESSQEEFDDRTADDQDLDENGSEAAVSTKNMQNDIMLFCSSDQRILTINRGY